MVSVLCLVFGGRWGADGPLGSMRIYPHLQDTGGFFVAVLQRKVVKKVVREDIEPMSVLILVERSRADS